METVAVVVTFSQIATHSPISAIFSPSATLPIPLFVHPEGEGLGVLPPWERTIKLVGWLALWPADEETISVWGAFLVPHNSKLTPKLQRQQLIFS